MSQPNTSDLVSTIATQLNIVIVALRLLVEMIQSPDAAPSPSMTPGTCPSRPPASPASPLFRTTTAPPINWAPCDQPELALVLQKTPTPTSTASDVQRTPLAHPGSPILAPCRRCGHSFLSCSTLLSTLTHSLSPRFCLLASLPFASSSSSTSPFSFPLLLPRLLRTTGPHSTSTSQTATAFFSLPLSPPTPSTTFRYFLGR